tara:strand:- start:2388 stop:3161 length:774 start_codon:yes stop_codon:yes gene_type:complete
VDIRNHLRHVPEIEKSIVDNKLDSLVLGLGPTAWLINWMDRKITRKLRLWGAHDIHRIIAVDDLVLMDSPEHSNRLRASTEALKYVVESRPKRLWLYKGNAAAWRTHLHHCMESVTKKQDFFVWQAPRIKEGEVKPKCFKLEWDRPHTGFVSPVGCTTLAWQEGCRRIGVLGVEMDNDHNTRDYRLHVDGFFTAMATQAHELGGCVTNLSPITTLKNFKAWQPPSPSISSSELTDGSATPEPNPSSNTPLSSTQPAQ